MLGSKTQAPRRSARQTSQAAEQPDDENAGTDAPDAVGNGCRSGTADGPDEQRGTADCTHCPDRAESARPRELYHDVLGRILRGLW